MGRRGGRGGGRQPREAWGQRGQAGRRRGPSGEGTRHWRPHGTRRHGCPAPPGGRVWQGGREGSTRTQDKRGREARPESRGAGSVGGGGHRRDPGAGCPSGAAVVGGPREPPGWPLERMARDEGLRGDPRGRIPGLRAEGTRSRLWAGLRGGAEHPAAWQGPWEPVPAPLCAIFQTWRRPGEASGPRAGRVWTVRAAGSRAHGPRTPRGEPQVVTRGCGGNEVTKRPKARGNGGRVSGAGDALCEPPHRAQTDACPCGRLAGPGGWGCRSPGLTGGPGKPLDVLA